MAENYDLMLLGMLVVLVALGLLLLGRLIARRSAARPVYEAVSPLLGEAERVLLGALEQALGGGYRVLCLVRLADLVGVRSQLRGGRRQKAQQAIDGERVDFVICRRDELSPAAVVELDKSGRFGGTREGRDALVALALEQAGVPLVRVPAQGAYAVEELKGRLKPLLQPGAAFAGGALPAEDEWTLGRVSAGWEDEPEDWGFENGRRHPRPAPAETRAETPRVAARVAATPAGSPQEHRPRCPACGAEMIRRRVTEGKNAGTIFWGCSGFPECRKVLPIDKSQSA
ncbi:hypothetical protein DESUT3_04990 [Desulfuromonas versatilis]|uniref:DUF2726 domain-containing protein n=1 Tax=Desulfuromonas versatilis TaxID=2802975 RepID=A0ABN6DTM0_9BACT|nr:DUF2726 domain-containing protein [Desulfuromonas versatilis]BCR03430.1 hypothetical protein DESUT3_04990 [Desulfuromonas versatilis]